MYILKNASKYIRCRVVPLPSSKAKIRNCVLIKQGSRFTPGKFFPKPLKASQKWELMPWKAERDTHLTNQICQEHCRRDFHMDWLDRLDKNNFLIQCINN